MTPYVADTPRKFISKWKEYWFIILLELLSGKTWHNVCPIKIRYRIIDFNNGEFQLLKRKWIWWQYIAQSKDIEKLVEHLPFDAYYDIVKNNWRIE